MSLSQLKARLSNEDYNLYVSNRKEAWKRLYPEGNGRAKKGYCLHHIDTNLRHTNLKRYIEWRDEDIVMMSYTEHSKYHSNLPEVKEKNRERMMGNQLTLGYVPTEETREKLGLVNKDKHWYNDGVRNIRAYECPDGCREGRIKRMYSKDEKAVKFGHVGYYWYTNGVEEGRYKECPEGFRRGRLKCWWNNGVNEISAIECPEGYVKGRLKKSAIDGYTK